jgi:hypothetical protein
MENALDEIRQALCEEASRRRRPAKARRRRERRRRKKIDSASVECHPPWFPVTIPYGPPQDAEITDIEEHGEGGRQPPVEDWHPPEEISPESMSSSEVTDVEEKKSGSSRSKWKRRNQK